MGITSRQSPGARIAALGHHLPSTVLTSEEVAAPLSVDAEWIVARTGIRERRIAGENETTLDMATAAARDALSHLAALPAHAGGTATVDAVLVATSTPESTMPSVAAQVAGRLGLDAPVAFDINAACAGFCHALAVADALIRVGSCTGVLVIGADRASAHLDWKDRDTAVLFADGAGAAVVLPHDRPQIGPVVWGSVGAQADLITITPGENVLRQSGRAVYRWASGLGPVLEEICRRSGLLPPDLAAFVPHQANLRIINALARHLDLGSDTVVATDVVDTGNTMAATIPIALSRMVNGPGAPIDGDVLLFGFGAGLSYAGQVVQLSPVGREREEAVAAVAARPAAHLRVPPGVRRSTLEEFIGGLAPRQAPGEGLTP